MTPTPDTSPKNEGHRFVGAIWFGIAALVLALCWLSNDYAWLRKFPEEWTLPFSDALNAFMGWFIDHFRWFFRWITSVLDVPFNWVAWLLNTTPWPIVVGVGVIVAHAAGGARLALFALLSFLYILVIGYWPESMNTLALVVISVPLAILVGFGLGVAGYLSKRAERIILPTLDLLQTVPAFAYLIPILLLFGIGPVVGLIASVLYASPPMARNTMLGLRRVGQEVVESGLMSGATPSQLFWRVRVPTALPQLLMGVNQATMASLSMVIIAAVIGGSDDIGVAVLRGMQKADFGVSLLSGIVIALIAMNLDRITDGFAEHSLVDLDADRSFLHVWRHWIAAGVLIAGGLLLARYIPALAEWPEAWHWSPAEQLNRAVEWVVAHFGEWLEATKNSAFFYIMLPIKLGLAKTISPFSWGFELTTAGKQAYATGVVVLSVLATLPTARLFGKLLTGVGVLVVVVLSIQHFIPVLSLPEGFVTAQGMLLGVFLIVAGVLATLPGSLAFGGGVALTGVILWFGIAGTPWLAMLLVIVALSWWTRGKELALFAFAGIVFLVIAGVWDRTALSIYLCGTAVLIAFTLGALLGIWAASDDRVSRFVRPINDTLQTMPLFVLLIPALMLFRIGEFTALIAIVLYAIVPATRYTEHALRNVSQDLIEAGQAMGCEPRQLLWQVKLPQAMPGIMLGLNQTIMYAIAMLVIAALVGTNGLGQQVYIGLSDGDFGVGMVAGFGMAIIAIIADRMTQPKVQV